MVPCQHALVEELDELTSKIMALDAILRLADTPGRALDTDKRALMVRQLAAMREYASALTERIGI